MVCADESIIVGHFGLIYIDSLLNKFGACILLERQGKALGNGHY